NLLAPAEHKCAASQRLGLDAEWLHICVLLEEDICAESTRPARSQHTSPVRTERSRSPLAIGTFSDHVTAETANHGSHMTLKPHPPPVFLKLKGPGGASAKGL
ncbi:unnamed protein product, partial [Staurois parvus]